MAANSIHEIRIKGYKSLAEDTKLELRPLTILAGANSSGKSSVMQPLLLLKQTLASPADPGVLELAGPNVLFTNFSQMFYHCPGKGKSAASMRFGFSSGRSKQPDSMDLAYKLSGSDLLLEQQDCSLAQDDNESYKITLRPGLLGEKEVAALPTQFRQIQKDLAGRRSKALVFKCVITRGFLDVVLAPQDDSMPGYPVFSLAADRALRQQLLNLIHIPGLRGNPQRDYPLHKSKGPRFDGPFQAYVAGIVSSWEGTDPLRRLGNSLQKLGLTWKVQTKQIDATRVEVLVGRLKDPKQGGAKDVVSIADVGFGVSQVLPALVALEVAIPGQIVHLEQPEIHLHPRAQRGLAKLLADAATKDARIVVETHSSILIRGIQTLIAKGELDPKLVKLHWFTRDAETGITKVSSADLDENGAFGQDWPEDFDETYLTAEKDYLDAVEARNGT